MFGLRRVGPGQSSRNGFVRRFGIHPVLGHGGVPKPFEVEPLPRELGCLPALRTFASDVGGEALELAVAEHMGPGEEAPIAGASKPWRHSGSGVCDVFVRGRAASRVGESPRFPGTLRSRSRSERCGDFWRHRRKTVATGRLTAGAQKRRTPLIVHRFDFCHLVIHTAKVKPIRYRHSRSAAAVCWFR